jgi:glycosyltransferase involved in cell wall biosynthesis
MPHLLVLSNDPLSKYVAKGEVKPRYFNPGNMFDRITVITPGDTDVAPDAVQMMAGDAELTIVPIGHFRPTRPWGYFSYRKRIREIVDSVKPDVIRAYNPAVFGNLAVDAAKRIGVPVVISVHNNYDFDSRTLARRRGDWRNYLWQQFSRYAFERRSLRRATTVVAAYKYADLYARNVSGRASTELIYNRVSTAREPDIRSGVIDGPLKVISVGLLDHTKGQDKLIRSLAHFEGVVLTLVGDGPDRAMLVELAETLGVSDRVTFAGSVANDEIIDRYLEADVYAWPSRFGGLSIVIIEAAAVGLPIILGRVDGDPDTGDIFGPPAEIVESTPEGFAAAFRSICRSPERLSKMSSDGYRVFQSISGDQMEELERSMYLQLVDLP